MINLEDEYYFGASRLLTLRRLIELERVKNEKSEKFEEEKRKWKIEEESEIFIYEDRQIEMCKPSINILSRRNLRKSNRLVILAIIVLLILIAIFILKRI